MINYNPRAWFWFVGGDETKVFSGATGNYVPLTDPNYLKFANDARPTTIASEDELIAVLEEQAPGAVVTTKDGLIAYAARKRYEKEVGGTVVDSVAYLTDRETQSKFAAAVLMAQINPSATFSWKVADSAFVSLDATAMIAVASAVGAYVQSCFAAEATVVAGIKDGTITTAEQIDAAFPA